MWYRSWALPGADGTWGYKLNGSHELGDPSQFHPLSKQPIQTLLDDWKTDPSATAAGGLDETYESITKIETPYCFDPRNLETRKQQRRRMKETIEALSVPGQTVLLVSHGGPVTHLFEELTGQEWTVHGESVYCCYSIYKKDGDSWTPVRVNEYQYLNETTQSDNYVNDDTP